MRHKPGLLDGFTSIDELLVAVNKTLEESNRLQRELYNLELKIVSFTYPSDGTTHTITKGTTVFNFRTGTVEAANDVVARMGHSLDSDQRDFLRSVFINTNKDVIVQLDSQDKIPVSSTQSFNQTFQEFTVVKITATVDTKVRLVASTSNQAALQYTDTLVIKGIDTSGNLINILVDGSGNIISVMKGDYSDTLKTIAVDDHGRMLAVLTDPEDVFDNQNSMGAAELAARLGSINTFERRGNVMYMDNFEDSTLKWTKDVSISGSAVKSNAYTYFGNYSMKLQTGVSSGGWADLTHNFILPTSSKFGIELAFSFDSVDKITMTLGCFDGVNMHIGGLAYSARLNKLYYGYNILGAEGWTEFQNSVDFVEDYGSFMLAKIVIDLNIDKFVRAIVNNVEYNLSAYNLITGSNAVAPRLMVDIGINNGSITGNVISYFDNFILTQNEP